MTATVRVVEATEVWLPTTQPWLHRLVRSLPADVEAEVLCERTSDPGAYPVERLLVTSPPPWWTGRVGRIITNLGARPGDVGLTRRLRERRSDVVHGHFGHHAWRLAKTARDQRIPLIASFYGLDVDYVPNVHPRWRRRYRELFATASRVLVLGPWMASRLVALGCSPDRIQVHHLGVDVAGIPFRARAPGERGPVRILVAAAFREKKGIPDAIRAAARLAAQRDVELTIIGDSQNDRSVGVERARIIAAIDVTGMTARTRLLPMMSHPRLMSEAIEHDIFLSPSRTATSGDTEGTPMALVEMAAAGLPIVSTRHADIPEVVRDGETGLLADEGDVSGIAERLDWLVRDPERSLAMAIAARRRVEDEFDADRQAARLASIYRAVVGS